MRIEHAVIIHADMDTVWNIFTDMTCWHDWNSVAGDVTSEQDKLTEGKHIAFCIRPFAFPVHIRPVVDEVIPRRRIAWSGKKYGIHAYHEFIFRQDDDSVVLTSRETFKVNFIQKVFFHVSKKRLHHLSMKMLEELKCTAENVDR